MMDKYEIHNKKVMDRTGSNDFVVVINEQLFDACEERKCLHILDYCVVSRPLKAMVDYPQPRGGRIKKGYKGEFGGYISFKRKQ